jgi:hypothetical protein
MATIGGERRPRPGNAQVAGSQPIKILPQIDDEIKAKEGEDYGVFPLLIPSYFGGGRIGCVLSVVAA